MKDHGVTLLIDVRLHNTSQLDGFAHSMDLEYLCELNGIRYVNDKKFAPKELTLKKWQAYVDKKDEYVDRKTGITYPAIDWDEYESEFDDTMCERDISDYIEKQYGHALKNDVICIQCTEPTAEHCHRRLVADYFAYVYEDITNNKLTTTHL